MKLFRCTLSWNILNVKLYTELLRLLSVRILLGDILPTGFLDGVNGRLETKDLSKLCDMLLSVYLIGLLLNKVAGMLGFLLIILVACESIIGTSCMSFLPNLSIT